MRINADRRHKCGGGEDYFIVIKNTSIFKKCKPTYSYEDNNAEYFVGVSCVFEGKAPDKFTITYAVWFDDEEDTKRFYGEEIWSFDSGLDDNTYITIDGNSVTRDEWIKRGKEKRKQAIAQLPDSAWQTYTVDIKSTLEKYEGKTPEGNPMGIAIPIGWGIYYPSLFPNLKDRTLSLDIRIDKEGNVELKEDYRWENELPANPYS